MKVEFSKVECVEVCQALDMAETAARRAATNAKIAGVADLHRQHAVQLQSLKLRLQQLSFPD